MKKESVRDRWDWVFLKLHHCAQVKSTSFAVLFCWTQWINPIYTYLLLFITVFSLIGHHDHLVNLGTKRHLRIFLSILKWQSPRFRDAYSRRSDHHETLHAAFHVVPVRETKQRGRRCGYRGQHERGGVAEDTARGRPTHCGGRAGGPRGRARAYRQPKLPLLRAAFTLALQQDPTGGFQGKDTSFIFFC